MLRLEDLTPHAAVTGLEPGQVVRIVTTEAVGPDARTVYYKTATGQVRERMLFRSDEPLLDLAVAGRPWAFDASGAAFKLATEAYRIDLAYLFDPLMAVHTANVEPQPHQITAVYGTRGRGWFVSAVPVPAGFRDSEGVHMTIIRSGLELDEAEKAMKVPGKGQLWAETVRFGGRR